MGLEKLRHKENRDTVQKDLSQYQGAVFECRSCEKDLMELHFPEC